MPSGVYIRTEECRKILSTCKKGRKRKPFSKEWLKNMSKAKRGFKHSEDTKLKMSIAKTGKNAWNYTHGKTKTREFTIWLGMFQRCNNSKSHYYHRYGGRGIKICDRWNEFISFLEDMGESPSNKHSIERINNDSNYSKENCRWATQKEQSRNRIQNVNYKGECALDACKRLGSGKSLISMRINKYGWSKEKAFTTPVRKIKKNIYV